MNLHKVNVSVKELAGLRMMLRVLYAQRLSELVGFTRKAEAAKVSDQVIMAEILKYTDAYRNQDHQLATTEDVALLQKVTDIDLILSDDSLAFYSGMLSTDWNSLTLDNPVFRMMAGICRDMAVAMQARFLAANPDAASKPSDVDGQLLVNMPSAGGNN